MSPDSASDSTADERPLDTNLFVTVSGPPGCGATTLAAGLADAFDCAYVSGGDIFRELADERGVSLSQLIAKADEDDELDRALDRRLRRIAEKWGTSSKPFVLESRLAGWLAGNRADLRIWLDAPEEVRVERTSNRVETEAEMRVREVSEAGRYESYYGVDVDDRSFYDLCINTARWDADGVLDVVLTAVDSYDPDADEGAFETEDVDV
ncbi:(d)CMP kinase [Haloplanus sp. GCM10025708]|uniref:(d)CMP kinase n=1 Tax=Haloferacaceae TaxID=1644056 RepID=UPI00360D45AF